MISIILCGLLSLISTPVQSQSGDQSPAVAQAVDQVLRPLVDSGKVVGMSVGILSGERSYVFGLGSTQRGEAGTVPTGKTIFEIGSVSKVFTASLLSELVERGEVSLDDPLTKFVPDGIRVPSRNDKPITLRHLATHSSGLPRLPSNLKPNLLDPYQGYTPDDLFGFLSDHTLRRDPGEAYEYSNYGVGLLGHILAIQANKTNYENLVTQEICKHLKMDDTCLQVNAEQSSRFAQGYSSLNLPAGRWEILTLGGAGGIRSTVDDMLRFASFCLHPDDSPLGSSIQHGWKPQFPMGLEPGSPSVGLAWVVNTDGTVWHNGQTGGYHSFLAFQPESNTALVLLSNSSSSDVDQAGFQLLKLLSRNALPSSSESR